MVGVLNIETPFRFMGNFVPIKAKTTGITPLFRGFLTQSGAKLHIKINGGAIFNTPKS